MAFSYCYRCKGSKNLCGLGRCPLLERVKEKVHTFDMAKDSVEGPSPPSIFVGRYGYPRITIGPLTAPMDIPLPERLESSEFLFKRSMEDIYSIRSSMVRGKYRIDARLSREPGTIGSEPLIEIEDQLPVRGRKILSSVQELALSARSLDTEMDINRYGGRDVENGSFDSINMPMGPSVRIQKVNINQNPKVPVKVEKIVSDTDVNASMAATELSSAGVSEDHLVRLFSIGLLGKENKRRMVPTRWTITAVDDILSEEIKEKLKDLPPLDRFMLFKAHKFGNGFLVALFPPPYRFEMMEQWQSDTLWGSSPVIHDHEGPKGRRSYASKITGAYYAARLSAARYLERIRRNAGISVIRWITGDYWAPLGVWVIRETVRNAMMSEPEEFETMDQLISAVDRCSGIRNWKQCSVHLNEKRPTTLEEFI